MSPALPQRPLRLPHGRRRGLLAGALLCGSAACGVTAATGTGTAADPNATTTATATTAATASTTTTTTTTCLNNLPTACPSSQPSYAGDVEPIITAVCQECHAAGGIGATVASHGGPPNGNFTITNPNGGTSTLPISSFDPNTAHDWSVYANIEHNRVTMLQDVFLCRMPPSNVSPLTDQQRLTLMTWLVCGAPNN